MPVTWSENPEKNAIVFRYEEPWTIEQFFLCIQELENTLALRIKKGETWDVIIDFSQAGMIPSGNPFVAKSKITGSMSKWTRATITVGANNVVKKMAGIVNKITGKSSTFHYVDTMDQAYALLERLRGETG